MYNRGNPYLTCVFGFNKQSSISYKLVLVRGENPAEFTLNSLYLEFESNWC